MLKQMDMRDIIDRIESKGYSKCDFCNPDAKEQCRKYFLKTGTKKLEFCNQSVDWEGIELFSWELGND